MDGIIPRGRKVQTKVIPAPTGGLNAIDELAGMPETDASVMTNLFPLGDRCASRTGFTNPWVASAISTAGTFEGFRRVMKHVGGGTETAFGAYSYFETVAAAARVRLRIYRLDPANTLTTVREITTVGSTDSLEALGEWTMFTSLAGTTYMLLMITIIVVPGVRVLTPTAFDGSAWSTPAITGLPEITLGVSSHRNRLWFYNCKVVGTPGKELSAFYLPIGAISGAVTEFSLGPYATKGGRIVAMRTWSLDGGTGGTDDLAVFLTDQGQALVYAGTDPSSSSTWTQVGVFDVGKVASWFSDYYTASPSDPAAFITHDNFAMKYGPDVLMATQNGVTSMNRVLRPQIEGDYTISRKIRPLLTDAAQTWSALSQSAQAAWQMTYMPSLRQLIVSVPTAIATDTSGSTSFLKVSCTLYVMNTETGAWCKFTGINAADSVVLGNRMYFIDGSRKVFVYGDPAETGDGDSTGTITWECRQAYSYFDFADNKQVTLMQPMLSITQSGGTNSMSIAIDADVDFNARTLSTFKSYTQAAVLQPQVSPSAFGAAVAAHLSGFQQVTGTTNWYATKYWWLAAGP